MKRIFSYTAKNGVKRGVCLSWNWTDRFVRYRDEGASVAFPCPFCGSWDLVVTEDADDGSCFLTCGGCGTATRVFTSKDDALTFWRYKRVAVPPPKKIKVFVRWLKFMFLPVLVYDYDCVEDAIEDARGE